MRNIVYTLAVLAGLTPMPSIAHGIDTVQYRDYREREYDGDRYRDSERRREIRRLDREISEARLHRDWPRVRRLEERRDRLIRR